MNKTACNRVEMEGKKFGKWEVISYSHTKGKKAYYNCKCECGTESVVQGTNMRLGASTQCKICAKKEMAKKNTGVKFTRERRLNISKALKGNKQSQEVIDAKSGAKDYLCNQDLLEIDPTRMEKERGLRIAYYVNQKKQKAVQRGKSWNLTNLEVANLIIQPCYYDGSLPEPYNGLDRIDSSKGYELGNVVPCCMRCNSAKNNMTVEEFKEHIKRIYNHLKLGESNE